MTEAKIHTNIWVRNFPEKKNYLKDLKKEDRDQGPLSSGRNKIKNNSVDKFLGR